MSDQDAVTPRVMLFRHGETEWAKLGRFTSTSEIELTQAGITQVSSAAARLVGAGKLLDPCRLAHIFVSPRERARATLKLLLPSSTAEMVTFTEDITEWNYGRYEGLKDQQIRALRQKEGKDIDKEWDIWSDGCEDGETMQQVTERLDRLISQIKEIQKPHMLGEKPADIVLKSQIAHGLILRCFVKRWLGRPINDRIQMMLETGAMAVASYQNNSVDEPAIHLGLALPAE